MMELISSVLAFFQNDFSAYVAAALAFLGGALALALVIPGEQPDKFLKSALKVLEKLSRK